MDEKNQAGYFERCRCEYEKAPLGGALGIGGLDGWHENADDSGDNEDGDNQYRSERTHEFIGHVFISDVGGVTRKKHVSLLVGNLGVASHHIDIPFSGGVLPGSAIIDELTIIINDLECVSTGDIFAGGED